MVVDLTLAPKTKRAAGEVCCVPLVHPDIDAERRGLWACYYVLPEATKELSAWLS